LVEVRSWQGLRAVATLPATRATKPRTQKTRSNFIFLGQWYQQSRFDDVVRYRPIKRRRERKER
jgi:hypothetical protein